MTGALEAEPREGILNYATLSFVADPLSSPALLREHEGTNEAVALDVYLGNPRLHAAEDVSLDVCRVCQCSEPDETKVLGISVPSHTIHQNANASTPALLREHAGTDEAVALDVYLGNPRLHAAEDVSLDVCRVCQCSEADKTGEVALKVLGISVPSHAIHRNANASPLHVAAVDPFVEKEKLSGRAGCMTVNTYISHVDVLMDLGCSCKNDLSLAHYACALRWFVSRGSVTCEICGKPALNVSLVDRNKVLWALKGKNALQHQSNVVPAMGSGETNPVFVVPNTGSEELVQVTLWFAPVHNTTNLSWSSSEQVIDAPDDGFTSTSPATKWAVEAAGILIATGLLTVTISWLLSPQVDKGVARRGLNVLLGGLCALSIVVFLRFGVLPRIKYGPARYWAILVVFWFLVFGVWASTTRNSRSHM